MKQEKPTHHLVELVRQKAKEGRQITNLAHQIGMSREHLSAFINGRAETIASDKFLHLAELLDVASTELHSSRTSSPDPPREERRIKVRVRKTPQPGKTPNKRNTMFNDVMTIQDGEYELEESELRMVLNRRSAQPLACAQIARDELHIALRKLHPDSATFARFQVALEVLDHAMAGAERRDIQ